MYIEGNGASAIGRMLDVKPGTIYSWIKKAQWAAKGCAKSL